MVLVCLVGNVLGRINEVNQRPARSVLRWATVCRQTISVGYVTSHPGQLGLGTRLWVSTISISKS